jgi:hypothetical protein
MSWGYMGALGGTRTPNLLIRRSVRVVLLVRSSPYPQARSTRSPVRACLSGAGRSVCERCVRRQA